MSVPKVVKKIAYSILLTYSIMSSANTNATLTDNPIIRYSVMSAVKNGYLDSTLTTKKAKEEGNFGIGGFSSFSGELILLDGQMYKIPLNGIPIIARDDEPITYIELTKFNPYYNFAITTSYTKEQLLKKIDKVTDNKNIFYTVKIKGTFSSIEFRTLKEQNQPNLTKVCAKNIDTIFLQQNIKGTIIGFINPPYVQGGIDYPGAHFHFISDDHKIGGHVYNFTINNAVVDIGKHDEFILRLPDTTRFSTLDLSKNVECPNQN